MVGKLEAALEAAGGDAAIEQFGALAVGLVLALALDGQNVAVSLDGDVLLREAGDGHGDAVGILAGALDIVGGIGLAAVRLRERVEHGEEAVEAYGRAIERAKIDMTQGMFSV